MSVFFLLKPITGPNDGWLFVVKVAIVAVVVGVVAVIRMKTECFAVL